MAAERLVVDRIACDGNGACAELLPEMIVLDDWGYPVVSDGAVPAELRGHARRAVAACPSMALRLRKLNSQEPPRFLRVGSRSAVAE